MKSIKRKKSLRFANITGVIDVAGLVLICGILDFAGYVFASSLIKVSFPVFASLAGKITNELLTF